MDQFINSIKPQKVYLDSADKAMAIANIAFYYWYENAKREPRETFMPAKALEQAFYTTLCDFSHLAGVLKTDSNSRIFVQVEADNLNMPIYTDTSCDIDFDTIRKSGFDTKLLNSTFDHARDVPAPASFFRSTIKLAEAHVIRLKNNSGICLFVSVVHCLVDGQGYTTFVKRWAEISRWILSRNATTNGSFPEKHYIHDRSFYSEFWDIGTNRIDQSTRNAIDKGGNALTRWIAWLSPETRGKLIKLLVLQDKRINCYFRIQKENIDSLRATAQDNVSEGMRISTNDVLTAAIGISCLQSMRAVNIERQSRLIPSTLQFIFGKDEEPNDASLLVVASLRPRVNRQDVYDYTGNMTVARAAVIPMNQLKVEPTPKTLASITKQIRTMVSDMDAQAVGQHCHFVNKKSDGYVRLMMGMLGYKYKLAVSNHLGFDHYGVDFGMGAPILVRPAFLSFPNSVLIMPCHPDVGGCEIAMTLTLDVAEKVIRNTTWMSLVDKFDFNV
ncbi:hypothetical protein IW138_005252 [Coemansia sp. RSA 986]|nr:hypothetical protein IW138_005252 [Coemansia sp. RSA 986]